MTQQFSIILPAEMADIVERKLKSGSYSSASDVMRDGLLALVERDEALDRWLREEVVAGHAEYLADPSKGVPATEVMDRIRSRRDAAKA
jgi:putative addiction module CopG family antidote